MGSLSKVVKKIARPKVLLPLAAIAIGGPMLAKAAAAKGAAAGTAAGAGGGLSSLFSSIFGGTGVLYLEQQVQLLQQELRQRVKLQEQ